MSTPLPLIHVLDVRNPRTGRNDYQIQPATATQVREVARRLRANQPAWAERKVESRCEVLSAWAEALVGVRAELIDALAIDTGRYAMTVGEIDAAIRNVRRWAAEAPILLRESEFGSKLLPNVRIADQYVPYPLVGCISPWNFPMTLSLIDAVPALAAGAAVLLKPSEVTPRFSAPLARAVAAVPELAAVLQVLQGDAETGKAIVDNADAVCFTGSVPTGRQVAAAAAARFIPAFLELGGKDPAIVLRNADLDIASDAILRGAIANNGHACMSIERVYVDQTVFAPFVEQLTRKAAAVSLSWPDPRQGYLGPLIFALQAEIIRSQLADAVAKGARIQTGGEIENLGGGLYCRPTVVVGVNHTMRLMREETFGPIVPVMPFATVDAAVELANDSEFGLSACVFAGSVEEGFEVGRRIDAGGISINDACMTYMTYEGEKNSFKYSGMGGSRMGGSALRRFFRRKALIMQRGRAAGVPKG